MTVGELRKLIVNASDDTPVLVTKTHYNGWEDEATIETAILVLDGNSIVITDKSTMDDLYCIKL